MLYTIQSNPNFNFIADGSTDADNIIHEIKNNNFTVTKGINTGGCWYKWSVNVTGRTNVSEVKGRSEDEARTNVIKMFKYVQTPDLRPQMRPVGQQDTTTTSSTASVPSSEGFVKPDLKPRFVFTIGDSANHHGMYTFEAHSASEAWEIGTNKFNSEFPSDRGARLGLWQRVLVPVHANRLWVSADMTKGIKTPSHFAVDVPVGLGLSSEEWSGPADMINNNADGVMSSVIQKQITHIASK
jgi:hypothetical protein